MANEAVPPLAPSPQRGVVYATNQLRSLGRNLATAELPEIFIQGVHDEAFQALYRAAVEKAHQAVKWYTEQLAAKRRAARTVRFLTVGLGGIAAIIPIISSLVQSRLQLDIVPFATLSAALAGSLVAFDRYFGYSTGYVRFTSARQEIQGRIERFQLAWFRAALQQTANDQPPPRAEAMSAGLNLIQELLDGVGQTIHAETQAWMAEFKQGVVDLEKTVAEAKAAASSTHTPAALKLVIDGWDQLAEPRKAIVKINDRNPEEIASPVYVAGGLPAGQYIIKVTGTGASGKSLTAADVLTLKLGETGAAQLKLV